MWQKQEARWSAEQEARNNLMRDVLVTIQRQVRKFKFSWSFRFRKINQRFSYILGK